MKEGMKMGPMGVLAMIVFLVFAGQAAAMALSAIRALLSGADTQLLAVLPYACAQTWLFWRLVVIAKAEDAAFAQQRRDRREGRVVTGPVPGR